MYTFRARTVQKENSAFN